MSRIGKQPVAIPTDVSVDIRDGAVVVSGPKGELTVPVPPELTVAEEEGELLVHVIKETKNAPALWGLTRSLLHNAVVGVTEGYRVRLMIEGIGYRASVEGQNLVLNMGYSHPVTIEPPEGVTFAVEKNVVTVEGYDKQKVGNIAAAVRAVRKPEPYKGKGIRYENEVVRRKAGKKAATK